MQDENKFEDKDSRPWLSPPEGDYDLNTVALCAVFSVETMGGIDQVLTVIEKLPKNESLLKTLTKKIIAECRVKGNYRMDRKDGVIEIYGDKRIPLRTFFSEQGWKYIG